MTLRLLALLAVVVGLQPTAFVAAEAVAADLQFAAFAATAIGGGENETASLPDSVLTEEQVYLHLFTDRSLSERIMSEMRRRGTLPDWELDYLEGDLYYNTGRSRLRADTPPATPGCGWNCCTARSPAMTPCTTRPEGCAASRRS